MMKIAVLVKQVPASESMLRIDDEGAWIDTRAATYSTNESDRYAVEEALQLVERAGSGEVVVVSLGPDRAQKAIREALGWGAARGVHIRSEADESDPLFAAKAFAAVLKPEGFDLILSGLQSADTGMGQTGIILGELLGLPTASLVVATELGDANIRVKRELEGGWFQWVTLPRPACLTIQSGLNVPRYPAVRDIMAAKRKPIKSVGLAELDLGDRLQSFSKVFTPSTSKQTEWIAGATHEVVGRLVDVFKNDLKVLT
jgi:electron transfer flavoprotein beta subunit